MQVLCKICQVGLEVLVVSKTEFTDYQESIFIPPYFPSEQQYIKEVRCPACGLLYSQYRPY